MTVDPFAGPASGERPISACIPFKYAKWPLAAVVAYLIYKLLTTF